MEKEWEPTLTAGEVHVPPRGDLSASGNTGFTRNHQWPKRWEAVGASRAGESDELSGPCGPRAGVQVVVERRETIDGRRRTRW
jgi:hypothetical protein